MFEGHRVVVCVPSGRYRYLRVMLSYVLAPRFADIIDEIRLWVNTDVPSDVEYLARMEQTHPKIKRTFAAGRIDRAMYDPSRNHFVFNDSVYRFYQQCVEDDTIYLKIDDDICYIDDAFFENMLRAVLDREKHNFACVANVFNIPYVTKVLQDRGTIADVQGHSTGDPRCPVACTNGEFAAYIHEQFLTIASEGRVKDLFFDSHPIYGRARIGTMAWTGKSFQSFGGRVGPRDEVELTTKIPETLLKPLWIVGNAQVTHFAFSHQRAVLEDKTDILQRYLALATRLNGDVAA